MVGLGVVAHWSGGEASEELVDVACALDGAERLAITENKHSSAKCQMGIGWMMGGSSG